jgi:hypothetical protein
MFVRCITYQTPPETIVRAIAYVRDEVMPAALATEGCTGFSMICNRETGRCITSSVWSSTDARDASGRTMRPVLRRAEEILGSTPTANLWEIAVMHRHGIYGEGASMRCTWLNLDKAELAHAIGTYRMVMLPAFEEMGGFCSASLIIDRDTGHAVSSATFESRDAMFASRPAAGRLRLRTGQVRGATVTDMQEFELALAHLNLREMA